MHECRSSKTDRQRQVGEKDDDADANSIRFDIGLIGRRVITIDGKFVALGNASFETKINIVCIVGRIV
jgi:hypothetical protein